MSNLKSNSKDNKNNNSIIDTLYNINDDTNSNTSILYKNGLMYFTKYEFQKALESFQKALTIAPNNEEYQTMV